MGAPSRREVATLWEAPEERPSRLAPAVLVGTVVFTMCAGGVLWMWMHDRDRRAQIVVTEREAHARDVQRERAARERAEMEGQAAAQRLTAETAATRLAEARAAAEEAARPVADVTWAASVETASGVALRPDTPCALEGSFVRVGDHTEARSLTVRCGDAVIYRSTDDAGADVAAPRANLREAPIFGSQRHEYMLSYSDEGARTGPRPLATASTLNHTAIVWRATPSPMRVTLFVRDVSAPREGPALLGGGFPRRGPVRAPSFAPAVDRVGRVTAVRGGAPVSRGERCTFTARPAWEFDENCRVALRCGHTWLYGEDEAGYLTCAVQGGRAVAALDDRTTDEGGDPRLTWRGSRVVVSDFTEAGEWSCEVSF